jgi:hypothetical protein
MSGTFVPLPRDINELKVKPVEKLIHVFNI